MIGGLGFQELLIILVIVLIIFGAGKLPSVGANLGKAIKGFKSSIGEDKPEELTAEQAAKTEQVQQGAASGDKAGQAKPQA